MQGKMVLIWPSGKIVVKQLTAPPQLQALHDGGGGYIEAIPFFDTVDINGGDGVQRCVAFCNEHGKLNGLPFNPTADFLYKQALDRAGIKLRDMLVGSVVVIVGDDELLAA